MTLPCTVSQFFVRWFGASALRPLLWPTSPPPGSGSGMHFPEPERSPYSRDSTCWLSGERSRSATGLSRERHCPGFTSIRCVTVAPRAVACTHGLPNLGARGNRQFWVHEGDLPKKPYLSMGRDRVTDPDPDEWTTRYRIMAKTRRQARGMGQHATPPNRFILAKRTTRR